MNIEPTRARETSAMTPPPNSRTKTLLLWTGLLASDTTAQLLIKTGSLQTHATGRPGLPIALGYSLLVISFALWMQILRVGRLSISLSATALLYITIPIASHMVLSEPLTGRLIAGAIFIAAGVFILGLQKEPAPAAAP